MSVANLCQFVLKMLFDIYFSLFQNGGQTEDQLPTPRALLVFERIESPKNYGASS